MSKNKISYAVLHLAVNPVTGPLSVMRQLALYQKKSGVKVAFGIIHDSKWQKNYESELRVLDIHTYKQKQPKLPGTVSFMYQRFLRPPIGEWVQDLASGSKAEMVVIHCHNAWQAGVFLPVRHLGNIKCRFVATFHGVGGQFDRLPIHRLVHAWMGRRLLNHNAYLSAVDPLSTILSEQWLKIPKEKFTIIPNGQEPSILRACPFILGKFPFTIGHVGSLTEGKGWEIATEAVIRVAKTGRMVRIIIAGRGPEQVKVEEYSTRFPALVNYLGYQSKPVENVFPKMDLLAVMSEREGLPMTVLEGMSVGVPVVTTQNGDSSNAVVDGKTGFIIPRKADELARVIIKLYDNHNLLKMLHENTISRFMDKFQISNIVGQYHNFYTS